VDVTDNTEARRYEAYVDGELAGLLDYRRANGRISLPHTEVYPKHEGQGIGSALVVAALDAAAAAGEPVLPDCPFVAHYVREHPEYLDGVDDSVREQLR
jgi:hypothetical protein